jgi:subtilisin
VVGGKNCSTGGSYDAGNGHGTHVAGTIAAKDDATGVVGVAPGARLHAVRVLDNRGSGSWSSVICGVDWVTANAAEIEVANMSLGGDGREPSGAGCSTGDALHDAVCNSVGAGVTYAVAAGNDAADAAGSVPAAYDEVITVSALADFNGKPGGGAAATCRADVDDTFADFSNFGADVDLIAPGVCINSTWKGGGYKAISGTSMASPHVAGAAALYKAAHAGASPSDVKTALQQAGNLDWNAVDDKDSTKEKLLNVDAF